MLFHKSIVENSLSKVLKFYFVEIVPKKVSGKEILQKLKADQPSENEEDGEKSEEEEQSDEDKENS